MNPFETNINLLAQSEKHYLEEVSVQEKTNQYELGMLNETLVLMKNNLQYQIHEELEVNYVKQVIKETNTLYFYVGLSGLSSLKYLHDYMTEGSRIVVLEKNKSLLAAVLYDSRTTELLQSGKVTFLVANESSLYQCVSEYLADTYLSVNTVVYFESYLYAFEDAWVKLFNSKLTEMVQTSIFMVGNDMNDTLLGLKHNIMNIDEVLSGKTPSSIKNLNLYQGKTAIIVAAGPSLNKQLSTLKKLKGKVLVFVADGALKVLLDAGIVPDAVCTTERVLEIYNRLYRDLSIAEEVVFLGLPIVHPNVMSKCKNKIIAYRKGEPICEWLSPMVGRDESFEIGMSCVHIGFGFAEYLGCSKIILIGQDLAYGEDGQTHALGASHETFKDVIKQLDISTNRKTKGYYGEEVYAEDMWHHFRIWYEQMIRKISAKVYNCTEGGAYIEGAIHMPFEEQYEVLNNEEIVPLIDAYRQAEEIQEFKKIREDILANLETRMFEITEVHEIARKSFVRLETVFQQYIERKRQNYNYVDKELERVIQLLNQCDRDYEVFRDKPWVVIFFQSHVNTLFQEMSEVKPELCVESVFAVVQAKLKFFRSVYMDVEVIRTGLEAVKEAI